MKIRNSSSLLWLYQEKEKKKLFLVANGWISAYDIWGLPTDCCVPYKLKLAIWTEQMTVEYFITVQSACHNWQLLRWVVRKAENR